MADDEVRYHNAPRDIFNVPEVMHRLAVIQPFEEGKYSDIPKWDGQILEHTTAAVLLHFSKVQRPSRINWFPYSQLRKAEDGQSVYATNWIIDKKGL